MSLEHRPARAATRATAEVNDPSLTVDQFCRAENISRSMLYRAWAEAWGPKFYKVGARRRVTYRARLEWQREREAAAAAALPGGAET